jgi:hypothetical protein
MHTSRPVTPDDAQLEWLIEGTQNTSVRHPLIASARRLPSPITTIRNLLSGDHLHHGLLTHLSSRSLAHR